MSRSILIGSLMIAILALLLFSLSLVYSKINQEDDIIKTENKTLSQFHDSSKKSDYVSENDLNIKVLYFEEKYNSINKRFDDLYILGSMIVLLLITINISLFINTQSKVDEYFKENFNDHLNKVQEIVSKSAIEFGKLQAFREQAELLSKPKEEPTI